MSNRIHPEPGEPFCPSCHSGDWDLECSDEHLSYHDAQREVDYTKRREAMSRCEGPCVENHYEHAIECGWLQIGGESDIHWAPCDCGRPGLRAEKERLARALEMAEAMSKDQLAELERLRAENERLMVVSHALPDVEKAVKALQLAPEIEVILLSIRAEVYEAGFDAGLQEGKKR